jgi:hypothetical protein
MVTNVKRVQGEAASIWQKLCEDLKVAEDGSEVKVEAGSETQLTGAN